MDGADAGRGRWGGPAVELLDEGITGLLIGGGGAVDAISGCFDVALTDTRLIFLPSSAAFSSHSDPLSSLPIVTLVTVTVPSNGYSCSPTELQILHTFAHFFFFSER